MVHVCCLHKNGKICKNQIADHLFIRWCVKSKSQTTKSFIIRKLSWIILGWFSTTFICICFAHIIILIMEACKRAFSQKLSTWLKTNCTWMINRWTCKLCWILKKGSTTDKDTSNSSGWVRCVWDSQFLFTKNNKESTSR